MKIYVGKTINSGIAIGKIIRYTGKKKQIKHREIDNIEVEFARLEEARLSVKRQLENLVLKAKTEVGEDKAQIFEAYMMLVDDEEYFGLITRYILDCQMSAEEAVDAAEKKIVNMFSQMKEDYFIEKAEDIKDVSNRLIMALQKDEDNDKSISEPAIIVTNEMTPGDMVQLDKNKVLAVVTKNGSINSHTALLARSMKIPFITGLEIAEDWDGKEGIVDAGEGKLIISPDAETYADYRVKIDRKIELERMLNSLIGQPDITLDGKEIGLYANIGSVSDVDEVVKYNAAGIGLFRSEFIYLERNDYPSEEEQFEVYKSVAQKMEGKRVVIRTLDIGADKQADYFNLDREVNPALGFRGIRICLEKKDLFKTQLRAIYRASAFGNIAIMIPMVISVDEVLQVKKICEEVKKELLSEEKTIGNVEFGIMIETPAAVMISDMLAKEVDFMSIGTNDLTQYTLAADRQNSKISHIYDSNHEAVLRMIKLVVDNGHKAECSVSICGEISADTELTEKLIQMGVDELSVSPSSLLQVRKSIRNSSAYRG